MDVSTGLQASKACVPAELSEGVDSVCVLAPRGSHGPSASMHMPRWYRNVGIHTGAQVCGPPQKMPGWAFHCPLGGLFSRCWVDRPRVPGTSEGRKARGVAGCALGPCQAPTVSSEQQAQGRTPAICRPGGLALGLRPREEMAAGQAQDGAREGRRGRERPGGPAGAHPPAGAFLREAGGRAGLRCRSACVCVCVPVHACVPVCTRTCVLGSGP